MQLHLAQFQNAFKNLTVPWITSNSSLFLKQGTPLQSDLNATSLAA